MQHEGYNAAVVSTATATIETLRAFKCHIKVANKDWYIIHKYSEFSALHDLLKDQYPSVQFKFPPKKGFFQSKDEKFVEKRRSGLESFVQHLLSDSRIVQNDQVRQMFSLPTRPGESSKHDNVAKNMTEDTEGSDEIEQVNLESSERKNARPSDFDFIKTIGKGSFGKVFMAVHKKERQVYAVKVLTKSHVRKRKESHRIMSERDVLVLNIRHPFLCGLHYSFQTRYKLYFVLSYLNGGELYFHLQREKRFSETRARFYAAEIGSALGYLHKKHIIHRDLKPENLVLDSLGHVVLTDFGLVKEGMKEGVTTSSFCGTIEYLAPEVVLRQPYDKTVDWWCLGSVLYEMLFGLPPFYSRIQREMYDLIVHQPLRVPNIVSSATEDVLIQLLQKDRHKRLGSKRDFKDLKQHSFFSTIDFEKLLQRKITPPYIPRLTDDKDTSYADGEALKEPVTESVARTPEKATTTLPVIGEIDFQGFTFNQTLEDIAEEYNEE